MAVENKSYKVTWEKKPLGFSIVMDTQGKNAYVSSVQQEANFKMGLKLASQIISINKEPVVDLEHNQILTKIKSATTPITLEFQPRKFADQDNEQKKQYNNKEKSQNLLFTDAPQRIAHRVNGLFKVGKEINGRCSWTKPLYQEGKVVDNVLIAWWPGKSNGVVVNGVAIEKDMWLITKESLWAENDGQGYACHFEDVENPLLVEDPNWKCFDMQVKGFVDSPLTIAAAVAGDEHQK